MAKASDLVAVTSEDVAQAWRDVDTAKEAAAELRHRFVTGDDTVTQTEIASQQGVVEWLQLVADRTENQRERYEVAYAVQARKDLRAEVLAKAADNGDELLKLVDAVYSAACEFVDKANAHDAQLGQWELAAKALGVPDRGTVSAAHEGLGIESGGTILIDSMRVQRVNAKSVLNLLFSALDNGILPTRQKAQVASARRIVANLGKAAA
jgi:hypothetical protein